MLLSINSCPVSRRRLCTTISFFCAGDKRVGAVARLPESKRARSRMTIGRFSRIFGGARAISLWFARQPQRGHFGLNKEIAPGYRSEREISGFTLLEMAAVIGLIAALSAIVIGFARHAVEASHVARAKPNSPRLP